MKSLKHIKTILAVVALSLGLGSSISAQTIAYLPSNHLYVTNMDTNSIIEVIDLGGSVNTLAVSPDGSLVYASVSTTRTSVLLETATNQIIAQFQLDGTPFGAIGPDAHRQRPDNIVISQDNTLACITLGNVAFTGTGGAAVGFVDLVNHELIGMDTAGVSPFSPKISEVNNKLYINHRNTSNIEVYDLTTYKRDKYLTLHPGPMSTLPNGGGSHTGVLVHPDGSTVYAFMTYGMMVLDEPNNQHIHSLDIITHGNGMDIAHDGSEIYVGGSGKLTVIDTATYATTDIALDPTLVADKVQTSEDGEKVYIYDFANSTTVSVDLQTGNYTLANITNIAGNRQEGKYVTVLNNCINELKVLSDADVLLPGQEFNVTLELDIAASSDELYALQAEIPFDANAFEVVSSSYTASSDASAFFNSGNRLEIPANEDNVAGNWTGAMTLHAPESAKSGIGTFATITFRVKPGVTAGGTYTIGLDNGQTLFSTQPDLSGASSVDGLCLKNSCVESLTLTIDAGAEQANGSLLKPQYVCDAEVLPNDLSGVEVTLVSSLGSVRTAITDASGAFSFTNLAQGTYTLSGAAAPYILPCESITVIAGSNNLGLRDMIAGDVDGDEVIGIDDHAAIVSNFGSANGAVDLNNDGVINIFDMAVLGSGFGASSNCN